VDVDDLVELEDGLVEALLNFVEPVLYGLREGEVDVDGSVELTELVLTELVV